MSHDETTIIIQDDEVIKKVPFWYGIPEMSIYRLIDHPNILKPIRGVAYNESVKSQLKSYIDIVTPLMETLTPELVRDIGVEMWFTDMLSALFYLSHVGISHNDIKLENMLFDKQSNKFVLFDFGFSTLMKWVQGRTGTQTTVAPEVLYRNFSDYPDKTRMIIDEKAEVYSLGITLYYVLTGSQPVYFDEDVYLHKDVEKMLSYRSNRTWLDEIDKDSKYYHIIDIMTKYDAKLRPTFLQLANMFSLNTIHQKLVPVKYKIQDKTIIDHVRVISVMMNKNTNLPVEILHPSLDKFFRQVIDIFANYLSSNTKLMTHFDEFVLISSSLRIVMYLYLGSKHLLPSSSFVYDYVDYFEPLMEKLGHDSDNDTKFEDYYGMSKDDFCYQYTVMFDITEKANVDVANSVNFVFY